MDQDKYKSCDKNLRNICCADSYSQYLMSIYLVINDLVCDKDDYKMFCMVKNNTNSNLSLARDIFVDVRTLLRYKKKYQDIKAAIEKNMDILIDLVENHFPQDD